MSASSAASVDLTSLTLDDGQARLTPTRQRTLLLVLELEDAGEWRPGVPHSSAALVQLFLVDGDISFWFQIAVEILPADGVGPGSRVDDRFELVSRVDGVGVDKPPLAAGGTCPAVGYEPVDSWGFFENRNA